jgi:hypothetical protein
MIEKNPRQDETENKDKWGMIVLLGFLAGVPIAGVIYSWLFK